MSTNLKTSTQKVKELTLNSEFKILNEFYSESCSNLNFAYIAKFDYTTYGRIDSIKIFNNNEKLVCQISKKEIEGVCTKYLAKQNIKTLKENIKNGDTESMKLLFLYNCIF